MPGRNADADTRGTTHRLSGRALAPPQQDSDAELPLVFLSLFRSNVDQLLVCLLACLLLSLLFPPQTVMNSPLSQPKTHEADQVRGRIWKEKYNPRPQGGDGKK